MIDDYIFNPDVPVDVPVRYSHDCSGKTDAPLVVTRTSNGWVYVCHRCGVTGFKPIRNLSPSKLIRWIKSIKGDKDKPNVSKSSIELPPDVTDVLPDHAYAWLLANGISDFDIVYYGIVYSPSLQRVILPVWDNKKLIYWQGRYVGPYDKDKPKYINIMLSDRKDKYFRNELLRHESDKVVLVEDILSAIKVGKVVNSIGLLGSHVPDNLIHYCSVHYKLTYIWLDYDKRKASFKFSQRARSFGYNVKSIITKLDPKHYTIEKIKEKLR